MSVTASSLEEAFLPLVDDHKPEARAAPSTDKRRRQGTDPLLKPIPQVERFKTAPTSSYLMAAAAEKSGYASSPSSHVPADGPSLQSLADRVKKLEDGRSTASILALLGVFLIALGLGIFVYARTS